ncbi:MAG: anti-sigma factor family protein [Planctomycetota bacterium]|jgi:anti-sigma factor RsiW
MDKKCDKISEERLVAFADGELSPGEAAEVSEHVNECEECRAMAEAMEKSLEIVRGSWAHEHEKWPKDFVPRLNQQRVLRFGAVAASILLVVGLVLIWRMVSEPERPQTQAQLEQLVMREGLAAQMLAVGDLLAKQPEGREYARERYKEIIQSFSHTAYAEKAKLRIKSL